MFLRSKRRCKDGKAHRYFSVVENRRIRSGRVAQRQVLFLGEINDTQQVAWRKTLEVFDEAEQQARTLSLFPEDREIPADALDGVQVKLAEMELRRPRGFGSYWLGCELWRQLGLGEFWEARLGEGREEVAWAKVLELLVVSRLAVSALERAIADRQPPPGLVHHSDRGIQYAGAEYTAILKRHGMVPSMSRPANPYDKASCESFTKTLKREEIYARRYDNLEHLRANIEEFIEEYYNRQRLHSALGYRSPEKFEQQSESSSAAADFRSATMQFFENEVNDKRVSEVVTGEGGSIVGPFPSPHPLLTDTGNTQ